MQEKYPKKRKTIEIIVFAPRTANTTRSGQSGTELSSQTQIRLTDGTLPEPLLRSFITENRIWFIPTSAKRTHTI